MARGFARVTICLAVLFLFAVGAAKASTINFVDGKTVTGSFVYDKTTNTVVSFGFLITAGGPGGTTFQNGVNAGGALLLNNQDGDQAFGLVAAHPYKAAVADDHIILFSLSPPLTFPHPLPPRTPL